MYRFLDGFQSEPVLMFVQLVSGGAGLEARAPLLAPFALPLVPQGSFLFPGSWCWDDCPFRDSFLSFYPTLPGPVLSS